VLARIKESGDIFWAVGDRPWVLDGATVHVSLIAFDDGSEATRVVDGESVPVIHANLTRGSGTGWDPTGARVLPENEGTCFLGVMKAGPFDISEEVALEMLLKPNPHGRPNSDVLRPRLTARDILQRKRPHRSTRRPGITSNRM
jgi:hypothetical protein